MVPEIIELYEFNSWANRRMFEALSHLTPEDFNRDLGSSFSSMRKTLVHIVFGEWLWLARWKGDSPTSIPKSWNLATFQTIKGQWEQNDSELYAYACKLTHEELTRVIEYRDTEGHPMLLPLQVMLKHVVNHSTYHRGQLTTMMRQVGARPAPTDFMLFYLERQQGQGK
jgi:uncharacterized damage-inducible protein DinB